LPKAAIIPHQKMYIFGVSIIHGYNLRPDDINYCVLPLYHSSGCLGIGAMIHGGVTMVLRRKFSATAFWKEAAECKLVFSIKLFSLFSLLPLFFLSPFLSLSQGERQREITFLQLRATVTQYIGELCRYLLNQPEVRFNHFFFFFRKKKKKEKK